MKTFKYLLIIASLSAAAGCSGSGSKPSVEASPAKLKSLVAKAPDAKRIVALADIHGDLAAVRKALMAAGAIDDKDLWMGKDLVLVQTGDQIDRGDKDKEVMDLLEGLIEQAAQAGGQVILLNGNHEMINVQGQLKYVSPKSLAAFNNVEGLDLDAKYLADVPDQAKARVAAFHPGGPYAKLLAKRDVVSLVGDTVFVHGGVVPEAVEYGLARINQETKDWLLGKTQSLPKILEGRQSPLWSRIYSNGPADCDTLKKTLTAIGAKRMVVGHTVQESGITSDCDQKVWRIDTGMSAHYGGPVQVLEIIGDQVNVLRSN